MKHNLRVCNLKFTMLWQINLTKVRIFLNTNSFVVMECFMKNIILIFFLFLSFNVLSNNCDRIEIPTHIKDHINIINSTEITENDMNKIYNYELNNKKQIISELNVHNKVMLWDMHLRNILKRENLEQSQVAFLNDSLNLIKNKYLHDRDNLLWEERFLNVLNLYADRLNQVFSETEIKRFFINLEDPIAPISVSLFRSLSPSDSFDNCNCSTSVDMCRPFRCRTSRCNQTDYGCGLFWAMSCDGKCSGVSIK